MLFNFNHKKIEAEIRSKDTDERTLFSSRSYLDYLTKIVRNISRDYNLLVFFDWYSDTAYTDGKRIGINPLLRIFNDLSLSEKTLINLGFLAHELFHILYTDFSALHKMVEKSYEYDFFHILKDINNIIEDSSIELIGTNYFTGDFRTAIIFLNQTVYDLAPEIQKRNNKLSQLMLAMSFLGSCGKIKGNVSLLSEDVQNAIYAIKPLIQEGRYGKNSYERMDTSIKIYNLILPIVKKEINDYEEPPMKTDNYKSSGGSPSGKKVEIKEDIHNDMNSSHGNKDNKKDKEMDSESSGDAGKSNSEKSKKEKPSDDTPSDKNKESEGCGNNNKDDEKYSQNTDNQDKNSGESMSGKSDTLNNKSEKLKEQLDNKLNSLSDDLSKIKDEFTKERAEDEITDRKNDEIKDFIKNLDFGMINKGISVTNNFLETNCTKEETYKEILGEQQLIINNVTNQLKKILKFQNDDAETGHRIGIFSSSQVVRCYSDGKVFKRNKDKSKPDVAFTIMFDLSGSMSGKRLLYGKTACITMVEVCRKLNIPIAVIGHKAVSGRDEVKHYHAYDFDSPEAHKYNIMSLSAGNNTREGVSLRYIGEYFSKRRQETNKIIIAISDGIPEHTGKIFTYSGEIANKDTQLAAKELEKKGVKVFGVNIGGESVELKKLYKLCINVNDISDLPSKLIGILKKNFIR